MVLLDFYTGRASVADSTRTRWRGNRECQTIHGQLGGSPVEVDITASVDVASAEHKDCPDDLIAPRGNRPPSHPIWKSLEYPRGCRWVRRRLAEYMLRSAFNSPIAAATISLCRRLCLRRAFQRGRPQLRRVQSRSRPPGSTPTPTARGVCPQRRLKPIRFIFAVNNMAAGQKVGPALRITMNDEARPPSLNSPW